MAGGQDHRLAEIKGLDKDIRQKLQDQGVDTVQELLARAGDYAARTALAKTLGLETKQLTEWVNRADLMRLKGVGTEMANLLEECGVDSCKELQHRVPENLWKKLKETNDERKITHHAPSQDQVTAWIAEAQKLAG